MDAFVGWNNVNGDMSEEALAGTTVHMTGIKGSGMVALAQILTARGARVRGTDTDERFYTDEILADLGIEVIEGFDADNVRAGTDVLYYSAAYDAKTHPELLRAKELSIPCYTYNDALGRLSEGCDATGIAGVHGKSTSTALAGAIVQALDVPATVVVGSMVPDFGNRAASVLGASFFIAETCEYRRHFLSFRPDRIMVTSIEADHLDYFRDYSDIFNAFEEYASHLSHGGLLVYCADDAGARDLAASIVKRRPDIRLTPYGYAAEGRFRVHEVATENEQIRFALSGFDRSLSLRLPGRHNAVNAAGVLALIEDILRVGTSAAGTPVHIDPTSDTGAYDPQASGSSPSPVSPLIDRWETVAQALSRFRGLKRRSERIGEAAGVTVLDDYAHHPTAISAEIQALREFFPGRRLVVDFMSHTYSRTEALLEQFAEALCAADVLVLHKIYASAREINSGGVRGKDLADAARRVSARGGGTGESVHYIDEPLDAIDRLEAILTPGDVLVTMGAGDNWRVGKALLERMRGAE